MHRKSWQGRLSWSWKLGPQNCFQSLFKCGSALCHQGNVGKAEKWAEKRAEKWDPKERQRKGELFCEVTFDYFTVGSPWLNFEDLIFSSWVWMFDLLIGQKVIRENPSSVTDSKNSKKKIFLEVLSVEIPVSQANLQWSTAKDLWCPNSWRKQSSDITMLSQISQTTHYILEVWLRRSIFSHDPQRQ